MFDAAATFACSNRRCSMSSASGMNTSAAMFTMIVRSICVDVAVALVRVREHRIAQTAGLDQVRFRQAQVRELHLEARVVEQRDLDGGIGGQRLPAQRLDGGARCRGIGGDVERTSRCPHPFLRELAHIPHAAVRRKRGAPAEQRGERGQDQDSAAHRFAPDSGFCGRADLSMPGVEAGMVDVCVEPRGALVPRR